MAEYLLKHLVTCNALATWISSIMLHLPSTSTPIVVADLNDGVRLQKTITFGAVLHRFDELTSCITPESASTGQYEKGAGALVRKEHHFIVTSAVWNSGPTFFGNKHQRITDVVATSAALHDVSLSGGPLLRLGRGLQLPNIAKTLDRIPSHARCWFLLDRACSRARPPERNDEIKLDKEMIIDALFTGKGRRVFFRDVEAQSANCQPVHADQLDNATPAD